MCVGKVLLNLGSGVVDFDRFAQLGYSVVIHVDRGYSQNDINEVNQLLMNPGCGFGTGVKHYLIGMDIFDFLDTFKCKVNDVYAERIFEHMEYTNGSIGRLLEAINIITTQSSRLHIIVPNALILADKIRHYEKNYSKYNHIGSLKTKLIINTEFCNIKADSHASVWTPVLARDYIESEGTWQIVQIEKQINFAGRDIYMKILCNKPH